MANLLADKSYCFAIRIVKLCQYLMKHHKEYVLSKQVLRSGTAIGALICESEFAQSRKDFVSKLSVSLKEANETRYWLRLLNGSGYMTEKQMGDFKAEIDELIKLLVSSIKTAKNS